MRERKDGCAEDEMVTVIDVYTRAPGGGIRKETFIAGGCAGCAAEFDCPSECDCGRCAEALGK